MVKVFATKSKGLVFDPRAGLEERIFLFFCPYFPLLSLSFFFLHIFFNVPSVLFVPTSRHTDNYSLPFSHNKFLNDCCNLRTNLLFQTSADSQNCSSRVPLMFLALFLCSESRCGARNSTYRISNVIKLVWLRSPYWCDTAPTAVVVLVVVGARELYCWPCWPWKMKHMDFIISMDVFFLKASPIFIGMGLCSPALRAGKEPL